SGVGKLYVLRRRGAAGRLCDHRQGPWHGRTRCWERVVLRLSVDGAETVGGESSSGAAAGGVTGSGTASLLPSLSPRLGRGLAGRLCGRVIGILSGLMLATMYNFLRYSTLAEADIFLSPIVAGALAVFASSEILRTDSADKSVCPTTESGNFFGKRPWCVLA